MPCQRAGVITYDRCRDSLWSVRWGAGVVAGGTGGERACIARCCCLPCNGHGRRRSRRGQVISAFDEFRAQGHLGPECLKLIYRLVREESCRVPVLMPRDGWRRAGLEDLLGGFLADRVQAVTAMLAAQAVDEASMGRLLRRSIQYWLIDQARKTSAGALRRTVEKVLATTDAFERVRSGEAGQGRWRLAGTQVSPWAGRTEDLVEAARAVPYVRIPQWSSTSRRPPVADRASIVAVAYAVLAAAAGSMETAQIVAVFIARFPVVLDPPVVPLQDHHHVEVRATELTPEEQVIDAEDELAAGVRAAEVAGMLSAAERRLVPHLADIPSIQEVLGCGRTQAYQHARRLKEKLEQLVGEGEDVRAVGLEVIRLCGGAPGPQ
jgi:hypothetical protein